jgi:hypothetical protein
MRNFALAGEAALPKLACAAAATLLALSAIHISGFLPSSPCGRRSNTAKSAR